MKVVIEELEYIGFYPEAGKFKLELDAVEVTMTSKQVQRLLREIGDYVTLPTEQP